MNPRLEGLLIMLICVALYFLIEFTQGFFNVSIVITKIIELILGAGFMFGLIKLVFNIE